MASITRRIASEPLVHFVIVGGLLFALDALFGSSRGGEERTIVVSEGVRRELADAFSHEHGRAPTGEELEARVEVWIRDEVLYREGVERGLDRGDPGVRARIASNMAYVLDARARVDEPTDDELRAFFDAHSDRWSEDELIDFTHVFVEGSDDIARARALELLDRLRAGASPGGLGDTFSGGRRYRRRRIADLAVTFGESFTDTLDEQEVGTWELRASRLGLHVVRVDARTAASAARFDEVRSEVRDAWLEEARHASVQREIAALRARWTIVE
jgi:hypothetical protein